MNGRRWIVDPGHGGFEPRGLSTPLGASSPSGILEKDRTLELARRLRARAEPNRVLLTRDSDVNLALEERAAFSRVFDAERFVSLHLAGEDRAAELWIHARATAPSAELAQRFFDALQKVSHPLAGIYCGELAVLDPSLHPPDTAVCMIELAAPALEASIHGEEVAAALAGALGRFDIWYEVPLVEQVTGMSCWAAAAAMIVGWRECVAAEAVDVARATGSWTSYRLGLEPRDVATLGRTFDLIAEPPHRYTLPELRALLERYGPLWIGEASPGLHVVVIAGMYGDGTADGTFVRIADPWPIGRGERYSISFRALARRLDGVYAIAGIGAQLMHARDARRCTDRSGMPVRARAGERRLDALGSRFAVE